MYDAVFVRLVVQIERSIRYPLFEDSHSDSPHVQFVCIFAKRMSARRSPARLTKISNDIEDGLFIAARAFSNVQSAICYEMEKELAVRTRAYHDAEMNKQK